MVKRHVAFSDIHDRREEYFISLISLLYLALKL